MKFKQLNETLYKVTYRNLETGDEDDVHVEQSARFDEQSFNHVKNALYRGSAHDPIDKDVKIPSIDKIESLSVVETPNDIPDRLRITGYRRSREGAARIINKDEVDDKYLAHHIDSIERNNAAPNLVGILRNGKPS